MTTLETLDLANVTGGVTGNDGGCIPPWPRPSGPLGPRDPLGPRNPPGPLGPSGPLGSVGGAASS